MKAYTDIEQSRKLAKILPIDSADMYWWNNIEEKRYETSLMDYEFISDTDIPAWSLAVLLSVLPDPILTQFSEDKWNVAIFDKDNHFKEECFADNPVDCCYEMILKNYESENKENWRNC